MVLFQIDFLQQKNREMERKMNDALSTRDEYESEASKLKLKTRQLEARNKELEYDLNDVDRMAKRLQTDKDIVVKEADREMTEAKVNHITTAFTVKTVFFLDQTITTHLFCHMEF